MKRFTLQKAPFGAMQRTDLHPLQEFNLRERGSSRAVFISQGCHNKLRQTRWLKVTEIYYLAILDGRSPKSIISAMLSINALGENLFASSQLVVVANNLWLSLVCRCMIPISASSSYGILPVYFHLHLAFSYLHLCSNFSLLIKT